MKGLKAELFRFRPLMEKCTYRQISARQPLSNFESKWTRMLQTGKQLFTTIYYNDFLYPYDTYL